MKHRFNPAYTSMRTMDHRADNVTQEKTNHHRYCNRLLPTKRLAMKPSC